MIVQTWSFHYKAYRSLLTQYNYSVFGFFLITSLRKGAFYGLGQFVELIRSEAYFSSTVFAIKYSADMSSLSLNSYSYKIA